MVRIICVLRASTHLPESHTELRAELLVKANADQSSADIMREEAERIEAMEKAEKEAAAELKAVDDAQTAKLEDTRKTLSAETADLKKKVDVEVTNKINNLDEDISGRLADLKEFVEGTVAKSIQEMTGKMDAMNTRLSPNVVCARDCCASDPRKSLTRIKKEMEPKLNEVEQTASRAVGSLETLKTRVALETEVGVFCLHGCSLANQRQRNSATGAQVRRDQVA